MVELFLHLQDKYQNIMCLRRPIIMIWGIREKPELRQGDICIHIVLKLFTVLKQASTQMYLQLRNFRSWRWGSSLLGLRMLDPPLDPPST